MNTLFSLAFVPTLAAHLYYPEVEPKAWDASWSGGFFCPCHGSMFDMVGRVYKGVPAPTNLVVPPHFFDGDILTIGEDKGVA